MTASIHDFPMPDYPDPREHVVAPLESIQRAKEDMEDERERVGLCVGCGVLLRHHWSFSGKEWVGCLGALKVSKPPRNPERWNDVYPAVTCEVRKALLTECGPTMEIHCSGAYTHDELLTIAHALAKAAIAAYGRELAK